ncbi:hypothetical protein [Parabacteroides faecis]|uniref:hypothetical protein n=1 Tax=Parabacteroides faecis TaxID=1217282 RepID=UPI003A913E93
MKTLIKLLAFSSLSFFAFTACNDDIESNGQETPIERVWTNVTMQLSETAQGSIEGEDLTITKSGSSLWDNSSALINGKAPGIYPLDEVYLVKVVDAANRQCESTKANISSDGKVTWFTAKNGDVAIIKGENGKELTLSNNDLVYFSSQENVTKTNAEESSILGIGVYKPIGDILFVSPNALQVKIENDKIVLTSVENEETYELALVEDKETSTENIINLERATTILSVRVALNPQNEGDRNNIEYIKEYIKDRLSEDLKDTPVRFRARFFFAGYPNSYDMTRMNPISGNATDYTAISNKWCDLTNGLEYPVFDTPTAYFAGFKDSSCPYLTPHDFSEGLKATIYFTFEISKEGASDDADPLYRGTIEGKFNAFEIMKRNNHMGVLFTINLSTFDELFNPPYKKSLVTRSAVEDELFGTMLNGDVDIDYRSK